MTDKTLYQQLSVGITVMTAAIINIFLGILIMTKGWGLEAKSYPWIILGGLFVAAVAWGLTASLKLIYEVKSNEDN